jgi:hypothetical protein
MGDTSVEIYYVFKQRHKHIARGDTEKPHTIFYGKGNGIIVTLSCITVAWSFSIRRMRNHTIPYVRDLLNMWMVL